MPMAGRRWARIKCTIIAAVLRIIHLPSNTVVDREYALAFMAHPEVTTLILTTPISLIRVPIPVTCILNRPIVGIHPELHQDHHLFKIHTR